jgi:hypothetical protein
MVVGRHETFSYVRSALILETVFAWPQLAKDEPRPFGRGLCRCSLTYDSPSSLVSMRPLQRLQRRERMTCLATI